MKGFVSLFGATIVAVGGFADASRASEAPVISVSSEPTGLTVVSPKTRKKLIPGVDIYSDGLVFVRRYDGTEETKRVDKQTVALMESLDRSRFYEVTEDTFHREIDRSARPGEIERIVVTDCPIWSLKVRRGQVTRSTKFYALWEMAEAHPKNRQLKVLKDAILSAYKAVGEAGRELTN